MLILLAREYGLALTACKPYENGLNGPGSTQWQGLGFPIGSKLERLIMGLYNLLILLEPLILLTKIQDQKRPQLASICCLGKAVFGLPDFYLSNSYG